MNCSEISNSSKNKNKQWKKNEIKLFEQQHVRTHWDSEKEKWYFSVVDVIAVLKESPNPQVYWRVMKKRLKDEGNETVTNCNGLKIQLATNCSQLKFELSSEHKI